MSDLKYVYAVARIRVKEKYLLNDADVSMMVGMKDEKSVLNYLVDRGWGDANATQNADQVLGTEEQKTVSLMHELKVDQSIFDVLTYPQIYHNLKAGIKQICSGEKYSNIFYDLDQYGEEEMLRILKDKDYDALPKGMRQVARRAYGVMLETMDGQKCDVLVDRACLDAMLRAGKKSKSKLIRQYEESTVAVTDIKIAVRANKTGKSLQFLKEALAPCDSLDVDALAVAAAKNEEDLYEYLSKHGYEEAALAIKESPSAFERWCDNRLIETIRPQKTNPASADPIVAYYLARQNEIKTARIILTAKANGFSEDQTRERVRMMYV